MDDVSSTHIPSCSAGNKALSAGQGLIEDSHNRKLVSVASCWNCHQSRLEKMVLGDRAAPNPAVFFPHRVECCRLPVETLHSGKLGATSQDPFDRLLVAQAMLEGLSIVSIDPSWIPYPIKRLVERRRMLPITFRLTCVLVAPVFLLAPSAPLVPNSSRGKARPTGRHLRNLRH